MEGIRQDVVNVNLSLVNTDWYIRQLRDNPVRPYRPDSLTRRLYGPGPAAMPGCSPAWVDTLGAWARKAHRRALDPKQGTPACLHTLTDDQILTLEPMLLPRELVLRIGTLVHSYPANTPMYVKDIMTLRLIQENLGRRPIYFALTAGGGARLGLDKFVVQQGMAFKLMSDTVQAGPNMVPGIWNSLMDLDRTRVLVWDLYRYARLFDVDSLDLEPTTANIAGNLSFPFMGSGKRTGSVGRWTRCCRTTGVSITLADTRAGDVAEAVRRDPEAPDRAAGDRHRGRAGRPRHVPENAGAALTAAGMGNDRPLAARRGAG